MLTDDPSKRCMTDDEICNSYRLAADKGEQINILAQLNCASRLDIIAFLRSHGYDTGNESGTPRGWSAKDIEDLGKMIRENRSYKSMELRFGRSEMQIRRIARRCGLVDDEKRKKPGTKYDDIIDDLIKRHNAGESYAALQKVYGIDNKTLNGLYNYWKDRI